MLLFGGARWFGGRVGPVDVLLASCADRDAHQEAPRLGLGHVVGRGVLGHSEGLTKLGESHTGPSFDGRDHFEERDLAALAAAGVGRFDEEPVPLGDDDPALPADPLADRQSATLEALAIVLLEHDDIAPTTPFTEDIGDPPIASPGGLAAVDHQYDRKGRILADHCPQAAVDLLDGGAPGVDLAGAGGGVDHHQQCVVLAQPGGYPAPPLLDRERRLAPRRGHQGQAVVAVGQGRALEAEGAQNGRLAQEVIVGMHL